MMPDIYIGSIAVAPLIVALIQVAKGLGLPTQYAPWLNATLTVLAYAVMLIVQAHPQLEQPVTIALNLLVTFLTAAGIYDIGKQVIPSR
ncbi:MAG: hypothetical protein ACUVSF_14010 [Anaerolineae bacterium]